jgi:branched-chain amino acid aminotransferase
MESERILVKLSENLKKIPENKSLVFGHQFTDHMLEIDWEVKEGWKQPEIKPYQKLSLDPSCTVFHYGTECFEGMKAYHEFINIQV